MVKYDSLAEGRVGSVLLRFSVPFLLSGFIQMAYATVDVFFIGHFASAASISGVFQGAIVMAVTMGIFLGLTTGGTILLGQYVGAKMEREAAKATGNIIFVFCVAAVIIIAGLLAVGKPILHLIQVPPEAVGEAWNYMIICICGVAFTMGYNVISAILRSLGDSKAPFVFILISCALNILLDYIFVGLLSMAARGAALATVIAQSVSFILSLVYVHRKGLPFAFALKDVSPDKQMIRRILKLGIPISVQSSLNNFSFVIIAAITNSMGVFVSAATGIVGTLTGLSMMVPMSLGSAISAISAQNIGAKKPERAVRTLWLGILMSMAIAVPFTLAVTFWPEAIVGILTKDPDVIRESVRYLYPYSWDCIFVCFVFCFNGFFNGCGKTTFPMLQESLTAFLIRIPASYLLKVLISGATIFHVGIATPLASLVSAAACFVYFRLKFSKDKLKQLDIVR